MADAWWQNKGCSSDLRDPMGCTASYTANNVGYVHSGGDSDPYIVHDYTPAVAQDATASGAPLQPTPVSGMTPNDGNGISRKYPTVACTSGGPVPGGTGTVTIFLPRGALPGGGFRSTDLVVVRPYNETDVARFGAASVANIVSTDADTEATFRPYARWLW